MEETIMQPEKSPVIPVKKPGHSGFFRRFWGPFFIILIAIMALVWFVYHNLPADSTKTGNDLAAGGYGGNAYDSSLPDCPDDLSGILNHEVFNLSDLDQVNPLGMLSPGGHTIPTDHMNLAHIGSKRIEIYSPGNVTLIFMDD